MIGKTLCIVNSRSWSAGYSLSNEYEVQSEIGMLHSISWREYTGLFSIWIATGDVL